jgi:hypothetical protein
MCECDCVECGGLPAAHQQWCRIGKHEREWNKARGPYGSRIETSRDGWCYRRHANGAVKSA